MLKKAYELSALCDAEVVIMVADENGKKLIFNSTNKDVKTVINDFKNVDEIKTTEDFENDNMTDESQSEKPKMNKNTPKKETPTTQ